MEASIFGLQASHGFVELVVIGLQAECGILELLDPFLQGFDHFSFPLAVLPLGRSILLFALQPQGWIGSCSSRWCSTGLTSATTD